MWVPSLCRSLSIVGVCSRGVLGLRMSGVDRGYCGLYLSVFLFSLFRCVLVECWVCTLVASIGGIVVSISLCFSFHSWGVFSWSVRSAREW